MIPSINIPSPKRAIRSLENAFSPRRVRHMQDLVKESVRSAKQWVSHTVHNLSPRRDVVEYVGDDDWGIKPTSDSPGLPSHITQTVKLVKQDLMATNQRLWVALSTFGQSQFGFFNALSGQNLMEKGCNSHRGQMVCEQLDNRTMPAPFREAIAIAPENRIKLDLEAEDDEYLLGFIGKCGAEIHVMVQHLPSDPQLAAQQLKECMLFMDDMKNALEILSQRNSKVAGIRFDDVSPIVKQLDAIELEYQARLTELGQLVVTDL